MPPKTGKVPKHQNKTAFKHNPKSKKTAVIASIPATQSCCSHCTQVIEWKRQYRKYKPLTRPRKCTNCNQVRIKLAYHIICLECASAKSCCAKCLQDRAAVDASSKRIAEIEKEIDILTGTKGQIPGLQEREKRSLLRDLLKEREELLNRFKQGEDIDEEDDEDEEQEGNDDDDISAEGEDEDETEEEDEDVDEADDDDE